MLESKRKSKSSLKNFLSKVLPKGPVAWFYTAVFVAVAGTAVMGIHTKYFKPKVIDQPKEPIAVVQPIPQEPPKQIVSPKPKAEKVIIYTTKTKYGVRFGFNQAGKDLFESGKAVIHIQYGYVYDTMNIIHDKDGKPVGLRHDHCGHYPSVDKITIGLFNPETGKYYASVNVSIPT